jgi:hypothetical protein
LRAIVGNVDQPDVMKEQECESISNRVVANCDI